MKSILFFRNKKAQSSMELVILVGAMMFVFITLLAVFQQNVSKKTIEQRNAEFTELALTVQNEISIATSATDGYQRTFFIEDNIAGIGFNISIIGGNLLYILSDDERHALSLPVQNVTGDLVIGDNVIMKVDGDILLNQ